MGFDLNLEHFETGIGTFQGSQNILIFTMSLTIYEIWQFE